MGRKGRLVAAARIQSLALGTYICKKKKKKKQELGCRKGKAGSFKQVTPSFLKGALDG